MSDRTPSGEGFGPTLGTIEHMLRDVREALQMDVAFVSKFAGDQIVFRALEGDAESFGWQEGESFPLDESYCKWVLEGRIPDVVPDARREDATKDLRVTLSCSPMLAYSLFQWGGEKRVPRPARRSFLRPR
jgi:hypothetical protein